MRSLIYIITLGIIIFMPGISKATGYIESGVISGTDETFRGTAEHWKQDSGMLDVTTNKGVTCSSRFVHIRQRGESKGVFKCSDGRNGPYMFTPKSTGADGWGTLDGKTVNFRIELHPAEEPAAGNEETKEEQK